MNLKGNTLTVAFIFFLHAMAFSQIKVACVGNSITYGSGLANRTTECYPAQLATLLGTNYTVSNFGVSGSTLLKKGDRPYVNQTAFTNAKNFNPDIVIIKLGTNDSKAINWQYKADFSADYASLINAFKALPSKPLIYICFPVPAYSSNYTINNSVIANEIIPLIRTIAKNNNVELIDHNTPFLNHTEWYQSDLIHPNAAGARKIAETAAKALTHVILYQGCNYGGWAASFPSGNYTMSNIISRGGINDDASSIRIPRGYKVTLYKDNNFAGSSAVLTANTSCFTSINFNDQVSSVRVSTVSSTSAATARSASEPVAASSEQETVEPVVLRNLVTNPEPAVFRYTLNTPGHVLIKIYSMNGGEPITLVNQHQSAGTYHKQWIASDKPNGIYVARMMLGNELKTAKILIRR